MTAEQEILHELYLLTQIEQEGELTEKETERYVELVEMCQRNNIEIPFGVEM